MAAWRSAYDLSEHHIRISLPFLWRFVVESIQLGPYLFACLLLCDLWSGIEDGIILYLSSRLLRVIEIALKSENPDPRPVIQAAVARLLCFLFSSTVRWTNGQIQTTLQSRVKLHFSALILKADLNSDIDSDTDGEDHQYLTMQTWYSFREFSDYISSLVGIGSQISFGIKLFAANRDAGVFACLCLAKPVLEFVSTRELWTKAYVCYADNVDYLRTRALSWMARPEYRQEVIGANLAGYVLEEHAKAAKGLRNISDSLAEFQYEMRATPWWDCAMVATGELPMLYYTASALLKPQKFTLSSIATVQQTSESLRWAFERLFMRSSSFTQQLAKVKATYARIDVKRKMQDGTLPFPLPESAGQLGVAVEMRDLSFSYPGSKSTRNALANVSLSIKSGELVVLVGGNGSGKSTILKVLSRLYDPASGQILLDGRPVQDYRIDDVRGASASLTQDHSIFPLSVRENIGVGLTSCISDDEKIRHAAQQGGASGFLSKFKEGMNTTLYPVWTKSVSNKESLSKSLLDKYETLEQSADVSGGERQRLIASRTFMRLNSDKVRLVVVDEPSSALDPEGELQLFEELRKAQNGKTMIFVTHRFGHLTKYADQVLCMKDGALVEAGKHEDLLARGGEYAKLYSIQAQAFSTT